MADVLIVCVREDEPLAKAFADMFERAGLHVGGAPGAPDDMRSCGAALVVWSQASIRSRAFLDAAQRAVNAGKAIVACLIAPPPPASINHAPAFDLSHWTGDPDDPVLDPLFFSVDRMVAAARAAAGVAAPAGASRTAEPPAASYFQTPPSASPQAAPPPYARARTPSPASAPLRPPPAPRNPSAYDAAPRMPNAQQRRPAAPEPRRAQDQVADEAQNWAAIRHSRNAEDFLRHLADFGQDGAFAELAQMKLAELEAEARRRSKTPAAAARQDGLRNQSIRLDPTRPSPQAPRPTAPSMRPEPRPEYRTDPRFEPPAPRATPAAAFEPIRSERPAQRPLSRPAAPRRAEPAPPAAWRDEPREAYRRSPAAPPRAGGGALRLMVIVAILGAGAVAAGLYAGDRLGGFGQLFAGDGAKTQEDNWDLAGSDRAGESGQDSIQLDTADAASVAASAPIDASPSRRMRDDPRAERGGPIVEPPPRAATPRTTPDRQSGNVTTTSPPSPNRDASQQPASVVTTSPPASGPMLPPQDIAPLPAPPTESEIRVASVEPTPPPRTTPARAPQVVWAARPSAARINELFPERAMRQGRGGRVELDCLLDAAGVPRCAVARETPAGMGFGSAAIRASAQFRAAPTLDDGSSSAGAQSRLVIVFRAPE